MDTVASIACVLCMTTQLAGTVSACQDEEGQRIIKLAEAINSRDGKRRTIEIRCHLREKGRTHVVVNLLFVKPQSYTMYISDGVLGRPIAFMSKRALVEYDPITDTLLYCPQASVTWSLGADNDSVRYYVWFGPSKQGPDSIILDVRSFFEGATTDLVTQATGPRKYLIVRTSPLGSSVEAAIDTRMRCPFTRLAFYAARGDVRPELWLDRIRLDEDIDPANFSFPDRKSLEKGFRVIEWAGEGLLSTAEALSLMKRVSMVRAASQNPALKETPEFAILRGVDWKRVENNDRIGSAKLKRLFAWPVLGATVDVPEGAPGERKRGRN